MNKHFISGKFKQARAYVFFLPFLWAVFLQGLCLSLVEDTSVQGLDPLVPLD